MPLRLLYPDYQIHADCFFFSTTSAFDTYADPLNVDLHVSSEKESWQIRLCGYIRLHIILKHQNPKNSEYKNPINHCNHIFILVTLVCHEGSAKQETLINKNVNMFTNDILKDSHI